MSTSPTVRRSAVQLPMTPPPRRTRCPTAPGNRAHWRAVASPEQVLRAWVLALALGEVLGFVAPAVTGVALVSAGVSDPWLVVGLTVAGLVEGLAIGWFGARVLGRD